MRALFLVSLCLCLAACDNATTTSVEDLQRTNRHLARRNQGESRGDDQPEGHGARHDVSRYASRKAEACSSFTARPSNQPYWMYQVKIPLDIVWMDKSKRVVEMVENAPPCKTQGERMPELRRESDIFVRA